jgi:hypothetical protein
MGNWQSDPATNPTRTINELTIIAVVTSVLFLVTASLGVWCANLASGNFSSTSSENTTKGFLIFFLVLSIAMPVLYVMWRYRDQIMAYGTQK